MFVSKLKTSVLALFAAGAVASSAGVYAYQQLAPISPDGHRFITVADGNDDSLPAKRLSDREYEAWRHELADRYKAKMQSLIEETSRHLLDDHLDKAATSTQAIEAASREWRWMLSHPGAKSMPKDVVRYDVLRTTQGDSSFYVSSRSGNDQALPHIATARSSDRYQPVLPTPTPSPHHASPAPHAAPAPVPMLPPTPGAVPTPGAAPLAPVPPAPPTAPPPPASSDMRTPAPPPPPVPSPASSDGDNRLDELERKVDRILKALEQLRGQPSSSRSSSRSEATPYSNSDPFVAVPDAERDPRGAK